MVRRQRRSGRIGRQRHARRRPGARADGHRQRRARGRRHRPRVARHQRVRGHAARRASPRSTTGATSSAAPPNQLVLQFDVDYDSTDTQYRVPGSSHVRADYEPAARRHVASAQRADRRRVVRQPARRGNTVCNQTTYCTWSQVLAAFPNAGVRNDSIQHGAFIFRLGGPIPGGATGVRRQPHVLDGDRHDDRSTSSPAAPSPPRSAWSARRSRHRLRHQAEGERERLLRDEQGQGQDQALPHQGEHRRYRVVRRQDPGRQEGRPRGSARDHAERPCGWLQGHLRRRLRVGPVVDH